MNADFLLDDDGDIPINARLSTGDLVTIQRVHRRLLTFRGEWMLDGRKGLPYTDWVAQKPPDVRGIAALVLVELTTTPGIEAVTDFDASFDTETRRVSISASLRLASDAIVPLQFSPALAANSLPYVAILYPSLRIVP